MNEQSGEKAASPLQKGRNIDLQLKYNPLETAGFFSLPVPKKWISIVTSL